MLSHFFLLFSLNLTSLGTGTQVFGTVRYSVGIRYCSVLGILVMANADGVRGVSGRNCSAICCVPPRDSTMAWQVGSVWRLLEGSWFVRGDMLSRPNKSLRL